MMDPKSIQLMCRVLTAKPRPDVLEWGCGGSTAFFSQFAGSWQSIEHDKDWGERVRSDLSNMSLLAPHGVVTLNIVERDVARAPKTPDGAPEHFASYCNAPSDRLPTKQYDVVLIDGRARVYCSTVVLRDNLLRDEESIVLMHDFERKWLHAEVIGKYYRAVEWDRTERRQLASMRPLPPHLMAPLPARVPSAVEATGPPGSNRTNRTS